MKPYLTLLLFLLFALANPVQANTPEQRVGPHVEEIMRIHARGGEMEAMRSLQACYAQLPSPPTIYALERCLAQDIAYSNFSTGFYNHQGRPQQQPVFLTMRMLSDRTMQVLLRAGLSQDEASQFLKIVARLANDTLPRAVDAAMESIAPKPPQSAKPGKLTLSPQDLQQLQQLSGVNAKGVLVKKDECLRSAQRVVLDLNDDGVPEVAYLYDSPCAGSIGRYLTLYVKSQSGKWEGNLNFPANGFDVLSSSAMGYRDIAVDVLRGCKPVWRWDGEKYDIYKKCQ